MGIQAQNDTVEVNDQVEGQEVAIDEDDPDALELAEALAAVEAEANEKAKAEAEEADEAKELVEEIANRKEPDPAPQEEGENSEGGKAETDGAMIPKGRFDEVNQARKQEAERARQLELEIAELRGRISASKPEQNEQPGQKALTPQDEITKLNNEIDDLWGKVDDGELSASDARRKEREIDARILELQKPAQSQKPERQERSSDELYLIDKTKEVVSRSEAAQMMVDMALPEDAAEWKFVDAKAEDLLKSEGLTRQTSEGLLRFRQHQVAVIEQNAAMLIPGFKKADSPAPQPENKGMSPEAKARAKKLEIAERQPASTNSMADLGNSTDLTVEQLAALSDEDYEALPAAVREKAMKGIDS